MKTIRSPRQMQRILNELKKSGKTVGFVPTMGALHRGHLSLVSRARKENDCVVVSVFVNPAQFGPDEDYLRYPRLFAADREACRLTGVDYMFVPGTGRMYPEGYRTYVTVEKMSDVLCGAFRPGHFRGVATVVAKLFNIVRPDRAYFGRKDFQQLKIIERMVKDMHFPVRIVPCSIVRESSGLALSSRNVYLSGTEREQSARIHASLQHAGDLIKYRNIKNSGKITAKILSEVSAIPGARIDYVSVIDPETLEPLSRIRLPAVLAVAVWVGKTRLIDNILVPRSRKS